MLILKDKINSYDNREAWSHADDPLLGMSSIKFGYEISFDLDSYEHKRIRKLTGVGE